MCLSASQEKLLTEYINLLLFNAPGGKHLSMTNKVVEHCDVKKRRKTHVYVAMLVYQRGHMVKMYFIF
jgi:hypothetical protein